MKITHDLNPEVTIQVDSEAWYAIRNPDSTRPATTLMVISSLDIAYHETRAALVAMYGKPVPVNARVHLMPVQPEVARVKTTLEIEGKGTISYEFPQVKELSVSSEPKYLEVSPPWVGWPYSGPGIEELSSVDFRVELTTFPDKGTGYTYVVKRVDAV